MSTSYPFLKLAQKYNVDYADVLAITKSFSGTIQYAEYLKAEEKVGLKCVNEIAILMSTPIEFRGQ